MGQILSSEEEIESQKHSYKYLGHQLTIKINESIREKDLDMPKDNEVNKLFLKELKKTDVQFEQEIPTDIKWNLLSKHRKAIDQQLDDVIEEEEEDKGGYYANLFNSKCQLLDLVQFLDWLNENSDDITSFTSQNGIHILMAHLNRAQEEAALTLDYNKQVLLLRVLVVVFKYEDVLEEIESYQFVFNQLVLHFTPLQTEINSIIFDLLSNTMWYSDSGFKIAHQSLENFQQQKNFAYFYEPFIRILEESNNILMINHVCAFLNGFVSAPSSKEKRTELKEKLLIHGISVVYGDIRLKINDKDFKIEDTTFESIITQIKKKKLLPDDDDEIQQMILNPNQEKVIYLGAHEQEEFEAQQKNVISQIEAFEELLMEIEDEEQEEEEEQEKRSKHSLSIDSGDSEEEDEVAFKSSTNLEVPMITVKHPKIEKTSQLTRMKSQSSIGSTHRKGVIVGQQRQSILMGMGLQSNNLQKRVSILDVEMQQLYLPDKLIEQTQQLYKNVKLSKTLDDLKTNMHTYFVTTKQQNVNLLNKLVEVFYLKINELCGEKDKQKENQQELTTKMNKSNSRADLEQQNENLMDKTVNLEVEISKLFDEKRKLQDELKHLKKTQNPAVLQENHNPKEIKLDNGKWLDVNFVKEKIQSLQKGLLEAQKMALNSKKMKSLSEQVENQRRFIEELKSRLHIFSLQSRDVSNEKLKQLQDEMRTTYEARIEQLEQSLRKVSAESKFTSSILSKAKDNLRKKLDDAQQTILDLKKQLEAKEQAAKIEPPAPEPAPPPPPPPAAAPPPPPPPPMGMKKQEAVSQRERRKPQANMKGVFWGQVKEKQTSGTVWEGQDDSKIALDYEYLERWFSTRTVAPLMKAQTMKPMKDSELRPERQKNVELVLWRLKMSNSMITNSLWGMDQRILTSEVVDALINILPQEQEAQVYKAKQFDKTKMAIPDLFFIELVTVPSYDARLFALRIQYNYKDEVGQAKERMNKMMAMYNEILQDQNLKVILLYCLAVGNFQNGSSNRADSYGFKFTDIEKILDIKATDPKRTLLGYAIEQAEKDHKKDLVDDQLNLQDFEFLQKNSIEQFDHDMAEIKNDINKVKQALSSQTDNEYDKAKEALGDLPQRMQSDFDWLLQSKNNLQQTYQKLLVYFCEKKETASETFFQKFYQFKAMCKNAKAIHVKQKQQEEKELEIQKIKEIQQKKMLESQAQREKQISKTKRNSILQDQVDLSKKSDKQEILSELRMRQSSKQKNTIKTSGASLSSLLAMQKKLKKVQE